MLSILSAAYYVSFEPNMIFPYVCSAHQKWNKQITLGLSQLKRSQSHVITSAPSIRPSARLLLSLSLTVTRNRYGKRGKNCTLNLIGNKRNNVHVILSL